MEDYTYLGELDAYVSLKKIGRKKLWRGENHRVFISCGKYMSRPWKTHAEWIRENCDGEWMWEWEYDDCSYSGINYYFRNVEDAVLFKLRF